MTESFSHLRIAVGAVATAIVATYAFGSQAQYLSETFKGVQGNQGCYYQAADLLTDYELTRKNLAAPLQKFETRLKHGQEMYHPQPDQHVQVMVVACTTSDDPVVWWRTNSPTIVLVTEGYLQKPDYR
jgi:hypothetical protein